MKYRKVILFLMFLSGAAAFCIRENLPEKSGIAIGRETYAAPDKRITRESAKIAVVNLDEGVQGKSGRINYAQKLSGFPSADFEYASLEAARTGLETGKYGAYVIIPAVFSQNVESINGAPRTSKLSYAVNRSYSGEKQYELLYQVLSYIDSLNNRLSYMYVDNILKEFHEAQDGADSVMENDEKDQAAIDRIQAKDLITLAEIPAMDISPNMEESLDISVYTGQNTMIVEAMREEYENGIGSVQTEITSMRMNGERLSEQLNRLSGQIPKTDLTTDANGEDIAVKADIQLREELERQSEDALKKENVVQFLNKLKDNNEVLREKWEQSSDILSDMSDNMPDTDDLSLIEEENQEIDAFLEEIEQAETLDIDGISELVKKAYVEPIQVNADDVKKAWQQRYEEELAAVSAYNEELVGFKLQIDSQFISQNVQRLAENCEDMQAALLKSNQAYTDYAEKTAVSATDYADELQRYITRIKEDSDKAIKENLEEAQNVKKETSAGNHRILAEFVSKLPYTRIGSAEYTQVYQFIANPLTAVDRSVN